MRFSSSSSLCSSSSSSPSEPPSAPDEGDEGEGREDVGERGRNTGKGRFGPWSVRTDEDVTFCGELTERSELSRVRIGKGRATEEGDIGPLVEPLLPDACFSEMGSLGKYSAPAVFDPGLVDFGGAGPWGVGEA